MRIPKRNLSRDDNQFPLYPYVYDLSALSADEVLVARGPAGLRAVSLHNAQHVAHEPTALQYTSPPHVNRVAFDTHTDTLLLLVWVPCDYYTGHYYQLVSLRRNASEWLEMQRLGTIIHNKFNFAVCDSRVLLVDRGWNTMYVFDVSAEHTLRDEGNVTWQSSFHRVACTRRDGVTIVAFSHNTSVSLLRLTLLPLRLEPLASVSLIAPRPLLFRGDLLLVADWNRATNTSAIVSFRVSGNALTERRVLLDALPGVLLHWALAGDRLVLWNWKSEELLVYAFT